MSIRPPVLRLFLVLCTALLVSCAGTRNETYFSPVQQMGIVVGPTWGSPSDFVVRYPLSESNTLTLILFDAPLRPKLRVVFYLYEGQTVQFEGHTFVASNLRDGTQVAAEVKEVEANYVINGRGTLKYLPIGDELVGATHGYPKTFGGTVDAPRRFMIDVTFAGQLPDRFKLQIPRVTYAGKLVTFPEVEFQRKIGTFRNGGPP